MNASDSITEEDKEKDKVDMMNIVNDEVPLVHERIQIKDGNYYPSLLFLTI